MKKGMNWYTQTGVHTDAHTYTHIPHKPKIIIEIKQILTSFINIHSPIIDLLRSKSKFHYY